MKQFLALLAVSFITASPALAEPSAQELANWGQWRGPQGNGVSPNADPPVEWSESKNIKWKKEVPGKGHASPIVWEDRVYVLTSIDTGKPGERRAQPDTGGGRFGRGTAPTTIHQFALIAYERDTGKEAWRSVAIETVPHESGHGTNTHASASPITDGKHIYASFGSQGIFCFDMAGKKIWERDLGDMQTRNSFGEGASPALYKDTLVVLWDHEGQSAIYALNAKSGETKWATGRDEPTAWGTPTIVEHKGKVQVITNGTTVRSYDITNGVTLWECGGQATNPIATPIVKDGIAYCMTGYRGYAVYAIPLDSKGRVSREEVLWSRTDAGPYVATGVLYEDLLYEDLLYYTKSRDAIMVAANPKTGEKVIEETRLPGLSSMYASMVAAKDRIYITSREGTTLVIKHGPKLQVLATNRLDEGIDASPAMVGKQMFIRGQKSLYCVEAK